MVTPIIARAVIPPPSQGTTVSTVLHPGDALSRKQRLIYILVLGALVALGPFTIDLYLPALPVIRNDFQVPEGTVQLTLSATIVGFALGQLVVGPWSDKVGRRLPLILATAVHIIACFAATLAPDVTWLMAARVMQGIGAAGGGVVAMAMVRDLFGGKPLVRMLSRLALVTGLAPILAPLIGSQLLLLVDWRGIFGFLVAYGVFVILAVSLLIRETLPKERTEDAGSSTVLQRYRNVLTDRIFVGVAIIGGFSFSGLFAYLAASPFIFQEVYGLDAQQYGMLFAVNSLGIVIGNQVAARLIPRVGAQWVLAVTTSVQLLMALAIILIASAGLGLVAILIPLWFFIAAVGFGFPCVQVLALVNHGHEAGTAASLLGAVNFGLAGVISPIVGFLGTDTVVPMATVMVCTAIVSIVSIWFIVRPRTVPALAN
jgi:DHA1 family bicyclomycin/chloramphenicol resistance-like MFS transporter